MKICSRLDGEMKEQWESAKESLEEEFNCQNETAISLNNSEVFKGILRAWESAEDHFVPMFYAWSFSEEEIEAMKKRKL